MKEVVIEANKQMSGYTFGLSPLQRKALVEEYGVSSNPKLHVSYKDDLKKHAESIRKYLVPLVLGLNEEQLKGILVKLVNVRTDQVLLTLEND